jgi:hypothetical protein
LPLLLLLLLLLMLAQRLQVVLAAVEPVANKRVHVAGSD